MNNKEFNLKIKSLNIAYMDIFGYIPCITDYSCSRKEYIMYMEKSVKERNELSKYLDKLVLSKSDIRVK